MWRRCRRPEQSMCGIAGIFNLEGSGPVDRRIVRSMANALAVSSVLRSRSRRIGRLKLSGTMRRSSRGHCSNAKSLGTAGRVKRRACPVRLSALSTERSLLPPSAENPSPASRRTPFKSAGKILDLSSSAFIQPPICQEESAPCRDERNSHPTVQSPQIYPWRVGATRPPPDPP